MKVRRQVLESVVAHARESFPCECCGILLAEGSDSLTVACALRADNAEKDGAERGFVLDHKAHLKAVDMEASGNARIVGYYHSHPKGGTRPSRRDMEHAIAGVTYLIVGVGDGRIEHGAWRLEGGDFVPEPLEVRD